MRDLDRIEERDSEAAGFRLGTVGLVLGALVLVGISGAVGVVVGRPTREPVPGAPDPLAALETRARPTPEHRGRSMEVDRTALDFPYTLTGEEERPEVLAALSAAAEEISALSAATDAEDRMATATRLSQTMPAAASAGPAKRALLRQAPRDPLVEAAIPAPRQSGPVAGQGEEGRYTLQVTSYDTAAEAEAFAAGLRHKGHRAFVTETELPDRGRTFRVRIGPFDTVYDAKHYRMLFERAERMNTFVVRRKD